MHGPTQCSAAPLAPSQQGLWLLQQLAPGAGAAHHLLFSAEVELQVEGLPRRAAQALSAMADDHVVLRTVVRAGSQGPEQHLLHGVRPDLRFTAAEGCTDDELRERARADSRAPFDLAHAPPWRVQLYRRAPTRWLIVFVAHHVLLDFWSLGLLLQDFAGRAGIAPPPALRPDGGAMAAHARRQQAWLDDPQRTSAWLAHWRAHWEGAPPLHGLPLDAPRSAMPSHDGRTLGFTLDRATSEHVRHTAREHGATPFMVLLAVYAVLLQRFSGAGDLMVAVPVAGRSGRAQSHLLGQFVNTVALRLRPGDATSLGDLLQQVRETVVGAMRHADCPFHWLVQQYAPRRDAGHAPVAQLGFSWERLPVLADWERYFLADVAAAADAQAVPGARLRPFPVPQQEGQHELQLEMGGERDGAFTGAFKYRTDLFQRGTVATMAECFVHLAGRLLAAPCTPLAEIGLDGTPGAARAAVIGRGPAVAWPDGSVLSLIGQQARRTPQAIAVRDGALALDYATLWHRASRIAAGLHAHGVQPGDRVGLMLGRRVDLVASLLGIWVAGAAYVALDPDFPPDRLRHTADDADLRALVSDTALHTLWPADLPVLCVDEPLPDQAPAAPPAPGDTAYILYTSGSSGRPKGVRVGHASLRNFLLSMRDILRWDESASLLAVTTPAFDISVLELVLPLLVGGEVRIASAAAIRDGRLLAQALDDAPGARAVTAMQATPATWRLLIDAGWAGTPGLAALCGGEALTPALAAQLQQRTAALWNLYGPTETTVWCTAARLSPGEPVHLGRPIPNTQLHVLDEACRALPAGCLGELWIGGDGLALDYWRQPALTAERFRRLPTLPCAGRLYRTGDRVRWNADGLLEHHGRLDAQVKLRGFRIEPGEIEAVLREQAGIADALVLLREDAQGEACLVAYLIAAAQPPATDALRAALRRRVPSYMLPAAFIWLDAWPLTPNGKIDRRALPPPDDVQKTRPARPEAQGAGSAQERMLVALFERVLGVQGIGIHDDFFALGGHSLRAVQLVAELERTQGVVLPVAELMQHATVASLVPRLGAPASDPRAIAVPLTAAARAPATAAAPRPIWFFHPIGGSVFCYRELARHLGPDRPVWGLQSPGLAQAGEAEVSVERMARRYVTALRRHQPEGPYLLGGWCFGGVVAVEAARQLQAEGAVIGAVLLIDTRAPIAAHRPADGDDALLLSWFARDLALPLGRRLDLPPEDLRRLAPEAAFATVLEAAKDVGVLPPDADGAQLARLFEAYLANGIALQTHLPAPLDAPLPVLLLKARDEAPCWGPALGWDQLAGAGLVVVDAPGDHHGIVRPPHAAAVASLMAAHLARHHPLPEEAFA